MAHRPHHRTVPPPLAVLLVLRWAVLEVVVLWEAELVSLPLPLRQRTSPQPRHLHTSPLPHPTTSRIPVNMRLI